MQTLIDFITFKDPNVLFVVLGMICLNASTAVIGTFAFLRKRALIGDAIAHSLLPGLCFGFLMAGEKNLIYLLVGSFITGWLSTFFVDFIVNRTRVKQDAAIGIVLSTFFAFGVVLLTYIQKNAGGQQAGLDQFLFGQAAAINKSEIWILAIILLLILTLTGLFFKSFVILSFNLEFGKSVGMPVKTLEFILTSLTVLAIAAGIQALGVILISALIITPAASARFWTHNLKKMILLAVGFSVFAGIFGAYISYAAENMPTGPWVVVAISTITIISIIVAPKKGLIAKLLRHQKNKQKILLENILKTMYVFHEKKNLEKELSEQINRIDLLEERNFDTSKLNKGIRLLVYQGLLLENKGLISLTENGKKESRRIVRLHRLWEQYLLKRTTIDAEHVHSGAEAIEHVLSPEIERELERELGIKGIPKEDY